ncbi:MAG: hypothetical protein IJ343_13135 [Clostridia bacterium]|nr:hypothetical protein [Clostridia bacterium]
MTHQIISSPQKPGVTYEQLRTIASTICHEYKTVLETTRMNGRISSSGRLLVVSKLINTDQFDEWARRVSGCKDPSILKPYDAFMSPDGSIYWVSGPSGFPINSICGILTEYLRNPANGNAIPTLLRMALSCLSSAEQCGLSVNMLFFNSSVNQMMADTSPRNDTGINTSTLVQSIINSHPALYQALVANASGYRPETLINVIDLWDQGQLPYQTTIHAGVSFHAPTYTANSFSQQIGESIGNMFGNILNIPPVRQGMPQNGGLTPTHGAGAPVHQPKHAAPEPAPRNKDAFSWSPGRTAAQPPRPPVQPAQNVQPPVRQTPQITVKPPQPIKTVTPVKKPKPQIAKVSAQVSQPAPNPAPSWVCSIPM